MLSCLHNNGQVNCKHLLNILHIGFSQSLPILSWVCLWHLDYHEQSTLAYHPWSLLVPSLSHCQTLSRNLAAVQSCFINTVSLFRARRGWIYYLSKFINVIFSGFNSFFTTDFKILDSMMLFKFLQLAPWVFTLTFYVQFFLWHSLACFMTNKLVSEISLLHCCWIHSINMVKIVFGPLQYFSVFH